MKRFFNQDRVMVALVAGLGSMLLFCLLLTVLLLVLGEAPANRSRWYGGMFIPLILVLRAYAKTRNHLTATRTLIITFFVSFVAFMAFLLTTHSLVLQ